MIFARVISGGQTGADQAGWRAARAAGLPTSGWMPAGFLTEDGPRPEFAELYGARETQSPDYPERTRRNVCDAAATIWFGNIDSRGSILTHRACAASYRDCFDVIETKPSELYYWLVVGRYRSINVAGNRESSNPGIGARVERFLAEVFRRLREGSK
jgi:hypothetical protein